MSIDADSMEAQIAAHVKTERESRNWSLAELAEKSGVSKAMLSKIERREVSPTAVTLVRIATAFGRSLAELVTVSATPPERLLRFADQPEWRDPDTNYLRRQIFLSSDNPMELVEVLLPRGAKVSFPAAAYTKLRHVVWVLSGRLEVRQGESTSILEEGDRIEYGPPADCHLRNPGSKTCRYLVAILRR